MKNNITILTWLILFYFVLKYLIPFGNYVLYPVNLLVTFLHEFWHAFFTLITWWKVIWITVNSDGSWLTTSAWWIRNLVIMWGYIWSAIFWNILLYIGFKKKEWAENIILFFSLLMIFVAIFWFQTITTSLILFILASVLYYLSKKTDYDALILQALGIFSILYIIQDFNVGPSSDLKQFSTILPIWVWMWIWLAIVIGLTWWNLRNIMKK